MKTRTALKTAQLKTSAARVKVNANANAAKKKANRKVLLSLGRIDHSKNGVVVYGDKPISLEVTPGHIKGAKRYQDNNCPVARAFRDSVLEPYITDAHVGEFTAKVWSDLNPDIEVKYLLDSRLYHAVKIWDKTGKWPLEAGIYWLNAYAKSLRRGYVKKPKKKRAAAKAKRKTPRAQSFRHITLRGEIRKAMSFARGVAVKGGKKTAKKAAKKR